MADVNCTACDDLKQEVPELITDGLDATMCTSLKNNTGLKTSSSNNDCTDLNNMNDCLVGNLETEVEKYELCDWKAFAKVFINNLWTVLKAMICAICGLWEHVGDMIPLNSESEDGLVEKGHGQVNKVWATDEDGNPAWRDSPTADLDKLDCMVTKLFEGSPESNFDFGEDSTGESKLVPGKGVDFKVRQAAAVHTDDVTIRYIAGGNARINGSFRLFTESFTDADGNTKQGNNVWNFTSSSWVSIPNGGELLYEIRIKRDEYPQLRAMFNGPVFNMNGYQRFAHGNICCFAAGQYAYGQHGWCNTEDGTPSGSGYSSGHLVPDGWTYVQVRLGYVSSWYVTDVQDGSGGTKRGSDMTLAGYFGMRINTASIEDTCE